MNYFIEDNLTQKSPFFIHHENIMHTSDYNKIHKHRAVEILYIKKGSAHIILDYNLYELKEGDIVFINSEIAHSLLATGKNEIEIFYVQFPPELIYDYGNNYFNMSYFIWLVACKNNNFLIYNTKDDTEPALHIQNAYDIYQEKKTGFEPAFISRILLICTWFFERSKDIASSSLSQFSYADIMMLNEIFKSVEKNYSTVSVTEITKKHSLTPGDLRSFSDIMGYSLREYIQNYRISVAKHLLSSTDMLVTEIVYSVGYNDSSYFSKLFTAYTGCTPSGFRKKSQISDYLKKIKNDETEIIGHVKNLADKTPLENDEPFYNSVFLSAYYDDYTKTSYRTNDFYEIIFNDIDSCAVAVDDRTYTLTPGDLIVIAPRERYKIISQSNENHILRIQFYLDIFKIGNYTPEFVGTLRFYTENHYRFFKFSSENSDIIQSLFSIYNQHLKFETSSEIIMRAGIMDITSWILSKQYESCPDLSPEKITKSTAVLKEVINYVDNYYVENLTLEDVANKFFINYSYLSRAFKKVTGQRFNRYINSKRLMKAAFLLATTDYSISKIASMVGFCSRSRFAERFIKHHDVSPTEFRRRLKEKLPLLKEHKTLRK